MPAQFEEFKVKYDKAIEGLPEDVRNMLFSYLVTELLVYKSKDRELSNDELETLKERMDIVVYFSERLTAQGKQPGSR